jgi:uncharacterized membrane protein (DUF2068 family)
VTKRALGLRAIALFEAAKGSLVLLAGSGLLYLVNRDVQEIAARLVRHLHLDPARRFPSIFLRVASESTPHRLKLLAVGAFLYAVMRFLEAYGLWNARRWAEWFAVATGVIYLPFEAFALARRPGPEPLVALVINLVVVVYLGVRLRQEGIARVSASAAGDATVDP